jgi:hypothetical protein
MASIVLIFSGLASIPPARNQETKELARSDPEHTFLWVQLGACNTPCL